MIEAVRLPSMPFVPRGMRAQLETQAAAMDRSRRAMAQRQLDAAVGTLAKAAGARGAWCAPGRRSRSCSPRSGRSAPTSWCWARGARGAVRHFLLGSVVDAALRRSPVAVLVAR